MTDHDCWACARDVAHDHDGADWSRCPHWPSTEGDVAGCCVDAASVDLDALVERVKMRRALAAGVPDFPPPSPYVELDQLLAEGREFADGWVWRYPDAPDPAA